MARFNEILVGRYNRFLQKLLSMKGGPVAAQLASEVQPIFPFFNGAENRYLEGWDTFSTEAAIAAVAANQSGFRLRNPSGSNVIAVLEKIFISAPTGTSSQVNLAIGQATVDLANLASAFNANFDLRGRPGMSLVPSNQDSAVSVPALTNQALYLALFGVGPYNTDLIIDDNQEFPLLPGSAIQITAVTVNVALFITCKWRERSLEDSERA